MKTPANETKEAVLGRVAAGVAHSFNNLLTVIQGYSTLELSRVPGEQPLAQSLRVIAGAAERGAKIAGQLLAYSSQQIMFPEMFDLNDHLISTAPDLQRIAGGHIILRLDLGADLPTLWADMEHFDEILAELVTNARGAIRGEGMILIKTDLVDVREGRDLGGAIAASAGPHFQITVADSGEGMDDTIVRQLFEPFFRDKEGERGIGMGLAAAQGIARQHQGWIEVESVPGKGSSFSLFLPAQS